MVSIIIMLFELQAIGRVSNDKNEVTIYILKLFLYS